MRVGVQAKSTPRTRNGVLFPPFDVGFTFWIISQPVLGKLYGQEAISMQLDALLPIQRRADQTPSIDLDATTVESFATLLGAPSTFKMFLRMAESQSHAVNDLHTTVGYLRTVMLLSALSKREPRLSTGTPLATTQG